MSDLKIGGQNVGKIYLGDKQLLQFDISKLYENLSYLPPSTTNNGWMCLIANLSTEDVTLERGTNFEAKTVVEAGKIDWYTIGYYLNNECYYERNRVVNTSNKNLSFALFRCIRQTSESANFFNVLRNSAGPGMVFGPVFLNTAVEQYAYVLMIFNM